MYAERHAVSLTTNASGAATGYTDRVTGRVLAVVYTKADFANGVDFTITAEATAEPILTLTDQNASGVFYPRLGVHGSTGAALLYAAGGTAVCEPVAVANDRVKVVVAQGGDTKTGTVTVIVG
jgi:hypothetical protein